MSTEREARLQLVKDQQKLLPEKLKKFSDEMLLGFAVTSTKAAIKFAGTPNLSYKDAKLFLADKKIISPSQFRLRRLAKWPIPYKPNVFYGNEWEGWEIFLNTQVLNKKKKVR